MTYAWHDAVGNIGAAVLVVAYLLLQTGRIRTEQLVYSVLNGVGAALIIVSLTVELNKSAMIIEVFWLLLSLYGIVRWMSRDRVASSRQGEPS